MTRDELLIHNVVVFLAEQFVEEDIMPTVFAGAMIRDPDALSEFAERMAQMADRGTKYATVEVVPSDDSVN